MEFEDYEPEYFDYVIRERLRQRNRGSLDIIYSMLKSCVRGALKTHILHKSNLSSFQVQLYLDFLLSQALIEEKRNRSTSRGVYLTTSKGKRYIETFDVLCKILIT